MVRVPRSWVRAGFTNSAGSWRAAGNRFDWMHVQPPVPQDVYQRLVRVDIGNNGIAQAVVASDGTATLSIGPSGVGTRWYPQRVSWGTPLGVADPATSQVYLGAVQASNVVAQSYAAGADVQGIAVSWMQPGDVLTVRWAGATPGQVAVFQVIGDQDVMTAG